MWLPRKSKSNKEQELWNNFQIKILCSAAISPSAWLNDLWKWPPPAIERGGFELKAENLFAFTHLRHPPDGQAILFQAMILTKENSREQIKGVRPSFTGVQRLWSLCSRAKSIKSSNRKISNCHWDYKSQITMHWDWDFVTHLKWGIWNFRITTSLSLKMCNMSSFVNLAS